MIRITFIQADGDEEQLEALAGDTIMDVAVDNGVAGILAQCGGGCTCCTCHCWIDDPFFDRLKPPHPDEVVMLEYAWGKSEQSRLACQVELTSDLDGIRVYVPEQQA